MRGFTLIEMMVVLGIVAILGGMFFLNFRQENESLALDRASHRIAQDIRRAANLALQSEGVDNCESPDKPASGYGLYVKESNPSQYIIYGECEHKPGDSDKEGYKASKDAVIETLTLESSIEIDSVVESGGGDDWSIAFFPPTPVVAICADDNCNAKLAEASVTLHAKSNSALQKTIKVYASGIVDIE